MKAWKEYIFIYIPIGIFCCVINFCVKKDNKSPNVRQYFFYEFEKNEYSMNDLYSGNKLGNISLCMYNGEISFSLSADETSGKYLVGTTENIYLYEKIALNDISTGASNDIEVATQIAKDMITKYGMSETLGPISIDTEKDPYELQLLGEKFGDAIGAEVKIMIDTAYARAQTILINNMPKLDKVAERLLEKEIISAEEFQELIK